MKQKANIIKIIIIMTMVLFQLGMFSQVIIANNNIKKTGYEYKFKLTPRDPIDSFRGRYLRLAYEDNKIAKDEVPNMSKGVYHFTFTENEQGFAMAHKIYKPSENMPNDNYLTIDTIFWSRAERADVSYFNLPFERFYIQEEYALLADEYMRQIMETEDVYAKIIIKNGKGQLIGVFIKEKPILDYLKENYTLKN